MRKWIFFFVILLCNYSLFATWNAQTSGTTQNINSVYFTSTSNGFVAGDAGIILKTSNSGSSWAAVSSGISDKINSIFPSSTSVLYFATDNPSLYKSTNNGSSWNSQSPQTSTEINSLSFFSDNTGAFVGQGGKINRTLNGGQIWNNVSSGTNANLDDVTFASSSVLYISGQAGTILKSVDTGASWSAQNSGISQNINSICFLDQSKGYACGNSGKILKTTNGGIDWNELTSGSTQNLNSIICPDSQTIYVAGANGTILKSTDAGSSWNTQTSNTSKDIYSIFFIDAYRGWASGEDGLILSTTSGGVTASISLNSPNGGEKWIFGSNRDITWSSSNISQVKIQYSLDGKSSWGDIATVSASDGTYSWAIPSNATTTAFIRIMDAANSAVSDDSDAAFTILEYIMDITSPNGGEEWYTGSEQNITWSSEGITSVNLQYSSDGGAIWNDIVSSVSASLGTFAWTLPVISTSTNAKIKILNSSDITQIDISDAAFTIQAPELKLTAPPDGVTWSAGDVGQIKWTEKNVNNITISYSTNSGTDWTEIANGVSASAGIYYWTIPNKPTSNARIKIEDEESLASDEMASDFTINGYNLDIISPNGGESWVLGTTQNITWTSHANIPVINLDYSEDNGTSWKEIETNITASLGTYSWVVSATASDSVLVRIRDSFGQSDESDAVFSFSDINIDSPSANEIIVASQTYKIEWTSFGASTLDIHYSTDGGTSWNLITNAITASQGEFDWNVPNMNENSVLLRLQDPSNTNLSERISISVLQSGITITSPETSSYAQVGTVKEIAWTYNFVSSLAIQYSINGGISWIDIATNISASEKSYDWIVPNNLSQNAKVKIYDEDNITVYSESGSFTITDESVELYSPNGGELYNQGETHSVVWNAPDAANIKIEYSTDSGNSWNTITTSTPANKSYAWTVGDIPSSNMKIRISDADKPGILDESDDSFVIRALKLTSPLGGQNYLINSSQNITWTSNLVSEINIYFSDDGGTSWNEVVKNWTANSGFYSWELPEFPTEDYLIKIFDPENTSFRDESDSSFTLTGLYLTSPIGGESWIFGSEQKITFESVDIDNVKIDYSTNGGESWITEMSKSSASIGSYDWTVPEYPGINNLVRVTDLDNSSSTDMSTNSFEIKSEGLSIVSPNGGESLEGGTSSTITWLTANSNNIKIEYTSDGGAMWNTISSATIASAGWHQWTVPTDYSVEYKVRISDVDNSETSDMSNDYFSVTGGDFDVPNSWDFISQTGNSSIIIIPTSISPKIGSAGISSGDVIGVFFTDGTEEKCAGRGTWDGNNLSLTIWGDNNLTSSKDGFEGGEEYSFKVWDASLGTEHRATILYSSGKSTFSSDGISILSSLLTHKTLSIPLEGGKWSMISSNLLQADSLMSNIVSDISDNLSYIKDDGGNAYYPEENIFTLSQWNILSGYQVYMSGTDTLDITGAEITASDYTFVLKADLVYILPYLGKTADDIDTALAELDNIIIVKNSAGEIYYPAYGINQIDTLRPGEGYKMTVSQTSTLQYPTAVTNVALPNQEFPQNMVWQKELSSYYELEHDRTGSSAVLIVYSEDPLLDNFQIASFGDNQKIYGTARFSDKQAALTIWGDNPQTNIKDGASFGEKLSLKYYNHETDTEVKLKIDELKDIAGSKTLESKLRYSPEAIFYAKVSKDLSNGTDKVRVSGRIKVYPLPSKSDVLLELDYFTNKLVQIEISDESGKIVRKFEIELVDNKILIQRDDLPSGVYLVKIIANDQTSSAKIVLTN
jgi:photosystem II stability/assembly factor-like uncharacterized protein